MVVQLLCPSSHSQYIATGAVGILGDEGGENQHERLGLRGGLSS